MGPKTPLFLAGLGALVLAVILWPEKVLGWIMPISSGGDSGEGDDVPDEIASGASYIVGNISWPDRPGGWRASLHGSGLEDTNIQTAPVPGVWTAEGNRSGEAYANAIGQWHVATNPRYTPRVVDGKHNTFCNICVGDILRSCNVEWPWASAKNIVAAMLAGQIDDWDQVESVEAQERANAGYPTIALLLSEAGGGPGHMAIVRPAGNTDSAQTSAGPLIAQAGARCFDGEPTVNGFGRENMDRVTYWTHD